MKNMETGKVREAPTSDAVGDAGSEAASGCRRPAAHGSRSRRRSYSVTTASRVREARDRIRFQALENTDPLTLVE